MNANDRAITGFTMLGHALFHTYELSIPVFLVAWLDAFDASAAVLGTVVGVGYALVGAGALPAGVLSDRIPSRTLVLASLAGMGGGFLALSAAPNEWVIAVALAVWGAAASLYHPAGLALLSRGTRERGEAFAAHGAAGNVGTVLGPLLAAVGLSLFDWRTVALAFVLPAVVGVALSVRIDFDETAAVDGGPAEPDGGTARAGVSSVEEFLTESRLLFTGGFVLVFLVVMLYGLYYRGVLTFLPEVLAGLPVFSPVEIAGATVEPGRYAYAGLLVVGIGGQYLGGRLTDEYDTVRLLVGAFAGLVVVSLAFLPAAAAGIAPLIAVCVVLGFGVYFVAPVYQATIADHVASERRGLSYGFTYLGMFGVGALGAALAGWVLTVASQTALFTVLAGIVGAAAVVAGVLLRR
ncbi:MFS transporter [Halobaculum gomorrense]|uniref:Predicted arabinose efflux permease, MFS family n=1 Tax=Halobaculum gomorrense TaxID=43928 RepID=A0A1M5JJX6_9EURY|nr:MFS transporter [Halobaculum gomorrense]SHG40884.1 Predicted arabinose efflux permease, MFS family [Halobaculum gomorrense]